VPTLEFHGTSDPLVTYTSVPRVGLPPIPQWLQDWATRDGCTSGPTTFFKEAEVAGEQWTGCQGGAAVVHYRIAGGGHTWPGATFNIPLLGRTTHMINATMLMWQFFKVHPLPNA
jgi:polyhydroxybutyrate depolymerase